MHAPMQCLHLIRLDLVCQPIGSVTIMKNQLVHLAAVSACPKVPLHIVYLGECLGFVHTELSSMDCFRLRLNGLFYLEKWPGDSQRISFPGDNVCAPFASKLQHTVTFYLTKDYEKYIDICH